MLPKYYNIREEPIGSFLYAKKYLKIYKKYYKKACKIISFGISYIGTCRIISYEVEGGCNQVISAEQFGFKLDDRILTKKYDTPDTVVKILSECKCWHSLKKEGNNGK